METKRSSVPARIGAHGRRAHAHLRRPQPRAGGRRRSRRLLPRARGVEIARRAGESVRLADDDGQKPRASTCCAASARRARSRPNSGACSRASGRSLPSSTESSSPDAIKDDQLRMMFSCCHPRLPEEAQVALVLHILCGFSVERDRGRLSSARRAAIEKRIERGKKVLADSKRLFDLADARLRRAPVRRPARALSALQRRLPRRIRRSRRCAPSSARRRCASPRCCSTHPLAATPGTLRALRRSCVLHAARLPARVDESGDFSSLFDQDRSRWDRKARSRKANGLLDLFGIRSGADRVSYRSRDRLRCTRAPSRVEDTDWAEIVSLYDTLLTIRPSPVIALNRAIAVAQHGRPRARSGSHRSHPRQGTPQVLSFLRRSVGRARAAQRQACACAPTFSSGARVSTQPHRATVFRTAPWGVRAGTHRARSSFPFPHRLEIQLVLNFVPGKNR